MLIFTVHSLKLCKQLLFDKYVSCVFRPLSIFLIVFVLHKYNLIYARLNIRRVGHVDIIAIVFENILENVIAYVKRRFY